MGDRPHGKSLVKKRYLLHWMSIPLYEHDILSYRIPFRTSLPLSSPEFEKTCLGCGQTINNYKWVETWTTWYKFAKFIFTKNHNFTNLQKYPDIKFSRYTVYSVHVENDYGLVEFQL